MPRLLRGPALALVMHLPGDHYVPATMEMVIQELFRLEGIPKMERHIDCGWRGIETRGVRQIR